MTQLTLIPDEPAQFEDWWFDESTEAPAAEPFVSGHVARWYQEEAHQKILESLQDYRSTLLVMATGTGKTQVFGAVARDWDGPVLVLAHRDELVQQAQSRLEAMTGEPVEIEQGQWRAGNARLVVASVQTMQRQARLDRAGKDRFSLVIADEAHHFCAKTFRRPLDYFSGAKVLGVTATPDRGDSRALGKVFDDVAYVYDIADAISDGFLVPITGKRIKAEEINLTRVTASKGELNLAELDEEMLKAVEHITHETVNLVGDRQTIAFFPGVRSAELAMHTFNKLRAASAAFVSGETDPMERRQIMDDYRRGRYQFLCNCQIATEGFDAPSTSVVVMGRPTLSRNLYAQMAGRGGRPQAGLLDRLPTREQAEARRRAIAQSGKPDCMILDFVGNSGKHDLATPEEILGGNYSDQEIAKAKERAREVGGGNAAENLRQAREELRRLAAEHAAQVRSKIENFNPFTALGIEQFDERYARFGEAKILDYQIERLEKAAFPKDEIVNMSRRQANDIIRRLNQRQKKNLCTMKQMRVLRKHGIDADQVTFDNARGAIDYLAATGWGRGTNPKELNDIAFGRREPGAEP